MIILLLSYYYYFITFIISFKSRELELIFYQIKFMIFETVWSKKRATAFSFTDIYQMIDFDSIFL